MAKDNVTDSFDNVYEAFVANDIPGVIGEYSLLGGNVEGKVERGEILKFLEFAGDYAREKQLTTMLWDCVPGYDRDGLQFSAGQPWRISLVSYDTPQIAGATGPADTFAIPTEFKGDQMKTMQAVYTDDGSNAGPIEWTSWKEWGEGFKPDYAANELDLGSKFFNDVQDDRQVKLTLYFWSGATMTYYVTESEGTVTGTVG